MPVNPFTPVFGGKPDTFFGRKDIRQEFDRALVNQGSDYRALFITGTRGYGKTALIEQLSRRAEADGRKVIDVGPRNPLGNIMRGLVSHNEETLTLDPEIEISVFGTGGKVRGGSSSKTIRYSNDDFEHVFMKACRQKDFKLFMSIDEIQKVSLEDVSAISNVFQMASRKGADVMLAVAGLPPSYEKVIRQRGCTFMRRAAHLTLGPLERGEVEDSFTEAFARIEGVKLADDALSELVSRSFGHPYVMQLQGYYLVERMNASKRRKEQTVTLADVDAVMPVALEAYTERAARPLVEELPEAEQRYLAAMLKVMNADRVAHTGDIARILGKEQSQVSRIRDYLLGNNIVYAPRRGELVFAVPYLDGCLIDLDEPSRNGLEGVERWRM